MSKILLTAFEPFGIIGNLRGNNASQRILQEIQAKAPQDFDFLILPVSEQGIQTLRETLEETRPTGIVSLGEHLFISPKSVKIEPYATQSPASAFPDLLSAFREKVPSDFAKRIGANDEQSSIGNYYCNRAYLEGLNWAKNNQNIPVIFIHTPVLGNHATHTEQVLSIIKNMEDDLHATHEM